MKNKFFTQEVCACTHKLHYAKKTCANGGNHGKCKKVSKRRSDRLSAEAARNHSFDREHLFNENCGKIAGAEYMFVEREAFHMVGRRCVTPDGGGAWGVARGDGTMETMMELQTGNPFCGLCFGFFEDGSNDNMVAVEYGDNVEGLDSFDYPAHKWLVYVLSGKTSEDLLGNAWWYINNKLLDELGIQKDALPTMEAYVEWDTENDKGSVEICIPYIDK